MTGASIAEEVRDARQGSRSWESLDGVRQSSAQSVLGTSISGQVSILLHQASLFHLQCHFNRAALASFCALPTPILFPLPEKHNLA